MNAPGPVRSRAAAGAATLAFFAVAAPLGAQSAAPPSASATALAAAADVRMPFVAGEQLVFRASVPVYGRIGTGTMRVVGADTVRGEPALLLEFEFSGRAGPFRLSDLTRSWIDPLRFGARRYSKRERSPLAARTESVEIFAGERRWSAADGTAGVITSDAPLDELAFLYFIRTLPLRAGDDDRFDRHYDARRNPVGIRVVGRERLRVPAGEFETVVVEMTVVDPARYGGTGRIVLHLTDDARRVPVRIVSSIPDAGRVRFDLEAIEQRHAPVGLSTTPR